MDGASSTLTDLVNLDRLTGWLDAHVPVLGSGPLECRFLHGGTSNVIVTLDRGDETLVLRRPPAIPPPNSEKAILREARILTALNGTAVPHPHCYGVCADASVIGAPFYVMEMVPGWAADLNNGQVLHRAPFDAAPYEYGIAYAMVDGLIALANVDYKAAGLGDYGKPDGFLERQVDRWDSQLKSYPKLYDYPGRDLPGYDRITGWLRANIPLGFKAGILHGDVGTPNALFHDGPPARLSALIDWELSTIGDPFLDLGWFTGGLRDERDPERIPEGGVYDTINFPTRQELARYYCAGAGRDPKDIDYYAVLALFKSACILEYKVAQAHAGAMSKETGVLFDRLVLNKFSQANWLLDQIGV